MSDWTDAICQQYYLTGQELVQDGRIDDGRRQLEEVVRHCPRHIEARGLLAWCLSAQGDHSAALRHYQVVLEIAPTSVEDLMGLATAAQALGQQRDADEAVKKALELEPQNAFMHQGAAAVFLNSKKLAEAYRSAKLAVELGPQWAASHETLGTVLFEMKRLDESELSFRKAIEISPEHGTPKVRLAHVLREQRRFAEALRLLDGLGEAYPPDQIVCLRSDALLHLGRFAEAEEAAKEALRRFPDAPMPRAAFGWVLMKTGRPHEALAYFQRNASEFPEIVGHALTVGAALSALGQHQDALAAFDHAMALGATAIEDEPDVMPYWLASREARAASKERPRKPTASS